MLNIAVVEDEIKPAGELIEFIKLFCAEKNVSVEVQWFKDCESFLKNSSYLYSIVFLDIELPGMNGMECAKQIRKSDDNIVIIFVTNMAQFAQKGYEVDALDFVIKPLSYADFRIKITKAFNIVGQRSDRDITIKRDNGIYRTSIDKIVYVEVFGHSLRYVLVDETIEVRGTLNSAELTLKNSGFLRCSKFCLVNSKYIKGIHNFDIEMQTGAILRISRMKKKDFMDELMKLFTGIDAGV